MLEAVMLFRAAMGFLQDCVVYYRLIAYSMGPLAT